MKYHFVRLHFYQTSVSVLVSCWFIALYFTFLYELGRVSLNLKLIWYVVWKAWYHVSLTVLTGWAHDYEPCAIIYVSALLEALFFSVSSQRGRGEWILGYWLVILDCWFDNFLFFLSSFLVPYFFIILLLIMRSWWLHYLLHVFDLLLPHLASKISYIYALVWGRRHIQRDKTNMFAIYHCCSCYMYLL